MLKKTTVAEVEESRIDAICADLNQWHQPGAAIGIAIGGSPVYRKAFGMANSELPVPLSTTTKMRIGSITKHFASLAYLLLCEKGRAGIDDPIGRYLPELHPVSRRVTARQLMAHISGLRDVFDICWQFSGIGHHVSSAELLSLYRTIDDVNAPPGMQWNYNNGGYLMLSVAIERIANRSLEDVLEESIFKPIGMYDTCLRRFDTDFMRNAATLHMPTAERGFEKSYLGTALAGEGGMVSTVDDMLLWMHHMDSPDIGTPEIWSTMKRAQTLRNGASTSYGLGLVSGHHRGLETIGHSGSVLAGSSDMLKVVSASLDIVVLVNRGDVFASSLTEKILDASLDSLGPPEVAKSSPQLTIGIFRSETTGRIIQLLVKDGKQIASVDGTEMPVTSDRFGVLRPASIFSIIKQSITVVGGTETPPKIIFDDFGNRDELTVMNPEEAPNVLPITGRYRSDSTGTEVTIYSAEDRASMMSVGRFGSIEYRLRYLTDGIWRSTSKSWIPWAGLLSFDSDDSGFHFTNLRTRALHFRRTH